MTRIIVLGLVFILSGCATMVSSATARLADSLSSGILNQDDLRTVADGAPAYLILIDGLIDGDPDNMALLTAGAKLYGAYAAVFVEDPERIRRMTDKAFQYAARGLCRKRRHFCGKHNQTYDDYMQALSTTKANDVPLLYTFAISWAGWIQARTDDWNAIADLAKVKSTFLRVVELNDAYDNGGAHLYLGILASLVPPAMGGKPKESRAHFERAITLSHGRNLMGKVQFAERYARLVFDRVLHDRLLREVLEAEAKEPGLTLNNTLAKQQARKLLESAEDYF